MAERIAGSGGTPYMMYVNNSGAVPIAGYSGTTVYPLLVDGTGKLETTASIGDVDVNVGSNAYMWGQSGTPSTWYKLLTDTEGKLITTASVNVESVFISSGADIGSVYVKDGAYVGVIQSGTPWQVSGTSDVLGSIAITTSPITISGDVTISDDSYIYVASSGTTGIPISGVVTASISTDPVNISGNVTFSNDSYVYVASSGTTGLPISGAFDVTVESVFIASGADIGSVYLKDGAFVGMIASGTTGIPISGEITVSDDAYLNVAASGTTGIPISGETTVTQATDPWIVLGSAEITNDVIEVSGNITVSDDSYMNITPSGTFYSTISASGTHIPVSGIVGVEFSNDYVNVIQSGTIWGVSGTADVLGSVAITNTVIQVSGDVTISDDNYLYVAASGITGIPISGETTTTQGTDPWITLGSTQVTNDVIEISGNTTISDDSYIYVAASGTTGIPISGTISVTTGSESYVYGKSGTDWIEFLVDEDGKLETTTSVTVDSIYIASGADIGSVYLKDGGFISVIASGTTGVPISGVITAAISTDPVNVSGDVTISDDSYIYVASSGTTGIPISGVVTVSNLASAGSLATQGVIGSVEVTNSTLEVEQARGIFGYSGGTFIASGTVANIITPGVGSKILLKGFTASAETATQFRLLFSGGGLINTFTLPASGVVGMNLIGMEPSGATNEPIGAGLFNNGSLHLSVYTQDVL